MTYFVECQLVEHGIPGAEAASQRIDIAFASHPNWRRSEAELREVRQEVTFALLAEEEDVEKVAATVETLFSALQRSFGP